MFGLDNVKPETFFKVGLAASVLGILFGVYSFYDESLLRFYSYPDAEVNPHVRYVFTGLSFIGFVYLAWELYWPKKPKSNLECVSTLSQNLSNGVEDLDAKSETAEVKQISKGLRFGINLILITFLALASFSMFSPIYAPERAIAFNHVLVGLLPDSFEPMKFATAETGVFLKMQLMFANLPLLPLVIYYPLAYIFTIATYKQRTLVNTAFRIVAIYGITYFIGYFASLVLGLK